MQWEWKFGPATIATILAGVVQIIVFVWVMSSNYTSVANRLDTTNDKVDRVAVGSRERFKTVTEAMDKYNTQQSLVADRVTKVEANVGFISGVVQRLETKLDGSK